MSALAENAVYCMDALELLRALPDASVDAVITDPPYGQQLAEWDKPVDASAFLGEAYRAAAPDSFLAFFHQLPQAIEWLVSAPAAGWQFVEHVVWLKRNTGRYAAGINRNHESLFIYRKGNAQFVETRGAYADVKVPGMLYGAIAVDSLHRVIDGLSREIRTGKKEIVNRKDRSTTAKEHVGSYRAEVGNRFSDTANFTNVWSFLPQNNGGDAPINHPSVKPLDLLERAVRLLTRSDALIVDPFAGSGTTLLAARNLGRRYIGSDTSPEYCDLSCKRLAEPYTLPLRFADAESEAS